jgi:two-component system phosphate regulon sensor histidine kinase PhoR
MKINKTYLFITISSIALLLVLIIQVNWILETAKIKESIFNEKANMVLARTTEELFADMETCQRISSCIEADSSNHLSARLDDADVKKIDSLFNHFMNYYNFHIDYTFVVAKQETKAQQNSKVFMNNHFCKSIEDETGMNGLQLKLILPTKKQFIMAEMGSMFISSVMLILIVLILFWRTIFSLLKEKKISEQTTEFLNNMTHEFKTPLTNIALASKMMLKEESIASNTKLQHYSEIILSENEKLSKQVEQVLGMTALERGEIPLHKSSLNLHDLINDMLKCMSVQIENKNGRVELALDANNPVFTADRTHLLNALCNLIDNAIKYSDETLNIRIETSTHENILQLKISDDGIGIDKEHQSKIFDKFYRIPTGNVHNVKGFGLGLAYVQKIIELHQASIEMQSKLGQGTTFIIKFKNE